jgi:hypothetical protein
VSTSSGSAGYVGSSGSGSGAGSGLPGTAVHDGRLTLDLRHPPTRAELGYPAGQNFVAYQSGFATDGGAPIDTTVILPGGTVRIPAYVVSADGGNPLLKDDPGHLRPPVDVVINRTFAGAEAAQASLAADAAALGISPAPDAVFQAATDYRAVHDWLSVTVTMKPPGAEGTVDVMYAFSFGIYHNPVRDAVVHDGVMAIDLSRLPTRDDLAFQPTYSVSDVDPEPGRTLAVRVTLPGGVIQRQVIGVHSASDSRTVADPAGTGQPLQTRFTLVGTTVEKLKAELLADAGALGVAASDIEAGFAGEPGQDFGATLNGRSTGVYDVSVSFGGKLGAASGDLNSATYTFTYRR